MIFGLLGSVCCCYRSDVLMDLYVCMVLLQVCIEIYITNCVCIEMSITNCCIVLFQLPNQLGVPTSLDILLIDCIV